MKLLKAIRRELNLTQREIAAYARISQAHYSNIERGVRMPSAKTALRIAAFLGMEWERLFEEEAKL